MSHIAAMAVGDSGDITVLTASDDERHMAATFLAYCGSSRA